VYDFIFLNSSVPYSLIVSSVDGIKSLFELFDGNNILAIDANFLELRIGLGCFRGAAGQMCTHAGGEGVLIYRDMSGSFIGLWRRCVYIDDAK